MAEEIRQTLGVEAVLKQQEEKTEDCTFDIIVNGKTVFSQTLTGRLPSKHEPTFLIKEFLEENKKSKMITN